MAGIRIRLGVDTDLRRRRAAVLLRLLLALPPAVVLLVWMTLAAGVLPLAWASTLLVGSTPRPLHRFLRGYAAHLARVAAWTSLLSGTYPGFRRRREHPVHLDAPRLPQPRPVTLLRAVLAVPAIVLASVFLFLAAALSVAVWVVAILRGKTTAGMQELGVFCLRYSVETLAYLLLLSPCYPRLAPSAAVGMPR